MNEAQAAKVSVIPWEFQAIGADECGLMFGLAGRTFLETIACKPGFPARVSFKPASWIAGEVKEYRDSNRASRPVRRRSRCNKSSSSLSHDAQSSAQVP